MNNNPRSYFLEVSQGHKIHYQIIGEDDHPSLVVIHGGPGVGCNDNDLNFVSGLNVRAILIDQRGAGKSIPTGSIDHNTTSLLIDDIIAILDHLNIDKTNVLGGSWGSSLALLFALRHQDRVHHIILRGLFFASKESRSVYEDPNSEAFHILKQNIPKKDRDNVFGYLYDQLCNGDFDTQLKYTKLFANYNIHKISEGKIAEIDSNIDISSLINVNRIKLHYMIHDFFIPDNYILDNINQLSDTPMSIVHGLHDEICSPDSVNKLAGMLPIAKIHWVDAGHNPREENIINGVREVVLKLAS